MLRWLLVEAGQTAAQHDPELRRRYQRLKFRRGANVAKVAMARRLAVRLYWSSARPPRHRRFACQVARRWTLGGRKSIAVMIGRLASLHEAGRLKKESWSGR